MKKSLTYALTLVLPALLASAAAAQSSSSRNATPVPAAVVDLKPRPWGKKPDVYAFSIERGVGGSPSEARADEQRRAGEVIHRIMREHGYKDYETFKIETQRPAKNFNTYYVSFSKLPRSEDELAR